MSNIRVGQGYDIHRLIKDKPLLIGGIKIESPVGSDAHSDGDALLHALIDAILGAAALGDIGDYFPPSDPANKNIDSARMLKKIYIKVKEKGFTVVNADMTIFLEKPKLFPYKTIIKENIADLLGIPPENVSVKAKTGEGFPPVGTQEAIATSATVLLGLNN